MSSSRAFSTPFAPTATAIPKDLVSLDQALEMETVVRQYFEGVHGKDPKMIRGCFGDTATIRDVCGLNSDRKTVNSDSLVERCMDFVAAHPDCALDFYYGPECSRSTGWVVAHWYERGTWSGESCGLAPSNEPMACEGQTRFRVNPATMKIEEFVVTRTFTEWEKAFLEKQNNS